MASVHREQREPGRAKPVRQPAPQSLEFTRITTNAVGASERFDYWRQLFVGSYLDRRPGTDVNRNFQGEIVGCADGRGAVFANVRNDPVLGTFGKRDSDLVLIGCVRRGAFQLSYGDGATILDARSGLVLFDCDRPATSSASTVSELSYLALPRSMVVAAVGSRDLTTPDRPMRLLPKNGLTPIMMAYLDALAEHGAGLDRQEGAAAMKAATELATALFARLGRTPIEEREDLKDTVFDAARHYIEQNYWRHDLNVVAIAASVGCSRTHLYRLFAVHGLTVAGYLRDVRLCQSRLLLETESSQSIGLIAFSIGYTDLTAFGKAFKRRFGMSPRDCRAMAMDASS